MCDGIIPLVSRCSCRYLKTRMNSLSDIAFIGWIKILFLYYSYSTNIYSFLIFEVTGDLHVKSVPIFLLLSMILVKTVLIHCTSGVIGGSFSYFVHCLFL